MQVADVMEEKCELEEAENESKLCVKVVGADVLSKRERVYNRLRRTCMWSTRRQSSPWTQTGKRRRKCPMRS